MSKFHCCVPLCTKDARYNPDNKLSFHRIPISKTRRKEWIAKIRRDVGRNFQLSSATRVCSEHFKPSDFVKTLAGLRTLKPDAVPSLFAWTTSKAERLSASRSASTKSRKALSDSEPDVAIPSFITSADISTAGPSDEDHLPCASIDHDYGCPPLSDKEKLAAAQEEIDKLNNQLSQIKGKLFFLERFSNDSQAISFYTGFKDYSTLKSLFCALQPTAATMIRWAQMQRHSSNMENIRITAFSDCSLPLIDQYFMFLCRIRQGFPEQDLAVRFGVSQSSVSRILITWANYLYMMLGSVKIWPSRGVIDENMPQSFKDTYPKTRVVIDCTEIKVQTPSSKVLNSEVYSNYKSHTTFKGLIGITPCGAVSFVSSLYTGSISDKEITARSGILTLLEQGDQVMADKGFLIQDLLNSVQADLVIPPFLSQKGKFSKDEVAMTHEIARLRIHVERAIRRIKEYHIFDGVVPISVAASINQIWAVCAILTNFRGPLF